MDNKMTTEERLKQYDIRVKNGTSQLYFKGEQLSGQLDLNIKQSREDGPLSYITITVMAILPDTVDNPNQSNYCNHD